MPVIRQWEENMKKRIVSVLLCAAMAASLLAGCGESEEKLVIGITNFEPMDYKDEDGEYYYEATYQKK